MRRVPFGLFRRNSAILSTGTVERQEQPDSSLPDICDGEVSARALEKRDAGKRGRHRHLTFKGILEESKLCNDTNVERQANRFLKKAASDFERDRPPHDVNWPMAMEAVRQAEHHYPIRYFDKEEMEDIQARVITYNLAKVVNNSLALKKLVDLGVDLANWEKHDWVGFALTLNFEETVAPRVRFLAQLGLRSQQIAQVLTDGAEFLQQDMDALKNRVTYLKSKAFNAKQIVTIVSDDPSWLTFSVDEIDARLGYFQKTFQLTGDTVRALALALPNLITWPGVPGQIRYNYFTLKEVCGFTPEECKQVLLGSPEVWMIEDERYIQETFDFLHNDVGFPHELLVKFSHCLTVRRRNISARHMFLKFLGRDQFDPQKANYVSPDALVTATDLEFCQNSAKSSIDTFNQFMKTL